MVTDSSMIKRSDYVDLRISWAADGGRWTLSAWFCRQIHWLFWIFFNCRYDYTIHLWWSLNHGSMLSIRCLIYLEYISSRLASSWFRSFITIVSCPIWKETRKEQSLIFCSEWWDEKNELIRMWNLFLRFR